jgi:hypothetical protein
MGGGPATVLRLDHGSFASGNLMASGPMLWELASCSILLWGWTVCYILNGGIATLPRFPGQNPTLASMSTHSHRAHGLIPEAFLPSLIHHPQCCLHRPHLQPCHPIVHSPHEIRFHRGSEHSTPTYTSIGLGWHFQLLSRAQASTSPPRSGFAAPMLPSCLVPTDVVVLHLTPSTHGFLKLSPHNHSQKGRPWVALGFLAAGYLCAIYTGVSPQTGVDNFLFTPLDLGLSLFGNDTY